MNYIEQPLTRRQKWIYLALSWGLAAFIVGTTTIAACLVCSTDYEIAQQTAVVVAAAKGE
jgi:hypothetical protein